MPIIIKECVYLPIRIELHDVFLFSVAVTTFWWAMVITVAHGENVLFLNLFKDEESSEILDSNLENDLKSTYNFDEYTEGIVFKNDSLNNTEPELIDGVTKLQPEHLEDELVSSTKEAANLPTSQIPEEKTEVHSKHKTNENSHLNTFSKATVEDGSSTSKKFNPVITERSEDLDSFVKFCFDIIAYFIHGVMSGITSVGDTSTNSKPTDGVMTDYSQSPSRKRKRDLQPEIEASHSADSNKDKSFETNVNLINKEKSAMTNLNIDSSPSLAQHEDIATSQDQKTSTNSEKSIKSSTTLEMHKVLNEFKTSISDKEDDSIISDHVSVLKNSNQEQNANSALLNNNSKKDVTELKKNVIEVIGEDLLHPDRTSPPNSPLQEENTSTHTKKKDMDLVPPLDSTEDEISNSFLLNDFINKQVTYFFKCHILAVFLKNESHCRNFVLHQNQTSRSISINQ